MLKKTASLIGATVVATGLVTAGATTAAHARPSHCYIASATTTTMKMRCSSGYGSFQLGTECSKTGTASRFAAKGNIATRTSTSLNAASGLTCPTGYVLSRDYYYVEVWD